MKKYKDVHPIKTIQKIRNILGENEILTKEQYVDNELFFSCRITLANNELYKLNIGSNGKGDDLNYSMASGYAEFMERLQNHALFHNARYASREFISQFPSGSLFVKKIKERNLIFDYIYAEDEEIWDIKSVINYSSKDLGLLYNLPDINEIDNFFVRKLEISQALMLPFRNIVDNSVKYLPIDLCLPRIATNGMCAGNSQSEAILQGICEIFERYSLKKIYYEKILLPTIPLSFFEDTSIADKIKYVKENYNYEVIIKDCSLGLGIPVVGILLIDRLKGKYNFKLGSDFVLSRALSRCLSELQQGTSNFRWIDFKFIDVDDFSWLGISDFEKNNFCKLFTTGIGYWPSSILSKNSQDFTPYNKGYGESDDKDLEISINIIKTMGYDIYLRDNSVLGFPSYQIIIPGMSNIWYKPEDHEIYSSDFSDMDLINKFGITTITEKKRLAELLEKNYNLMKYHNYNYTSKYLYNTNYDIMNLDIDLFLFMLFYSIKYYSKAHHYITKFLIGKDFTLFRYYFAVADYIKFYYLDTKEFEEIYPKLIILYGQEIIDEMLSDFSHENIFHYYDFPTCFNCEKCSVAETCHFFDLLQIEKRLIKSCN